MGVELIRQRCGAHFGAALQHFLAELLRATSAVWHAATM
jgi:hypothetical protein